MSSPSTRLRVLGSATWVVALLGGAAGIYALGTGCDAAINGIYDGGALTPPQQVGMGGDVNTIFGPNGFDPVSETFLYTPQVDGTPNPAEPVTIDITDYATTCTPQGVVPQSPAGGPVAGQHLLSLVLTSSQANTYTIYDPLEGGVPSDGGAFASAVLTMPGMPAEYATSGTVTVETIQGTNISGTFSIEVSADPGGAQANSLTGPFWSPTACAN